MEATLNSFKYCLDYLAEQLKDVDETKFAFLPTGISIHPAWVVGHLTISCQAIGGEIGLQPWLPSEYQSLFGAGSVPCNDPDMYETKRKLLAGLSDSQLRISNAVREFSDAQLSATLPDENFRLQFPTIKDAITQVLVGHTSYHIGQISIWRRLAALPALERSFA